MDAAAVSSDHTNGVAQGMPTLLDAPARREYRAPMHDTVRAVGFRVGIDSIPTRRCGATTVAEVSGSGGACSTIDDLRDAIAEIRHRPDDQDAHVELATAIASDRSDLSVHA